MVWCNSPLVAVGGGGASLGKDALGALLSDPRVRRRVADASFAAHLKALGDFEAAATAEEPALANRAT